MRDPTGFAKAGATRMANATAPETSANQADLFAVPARAAERPSDEVVALVRARLYATLALVKSAKAMPWTDTLSVVREDNAFRFGKDALPADEAAALWAEFDAEMDRLYAVMNEGTEPDLGDQRPGDSSASCRD